MNEEFLKIEEKNKELIDIAKKYMSKVEDPKHSTIHMESVVKYVKEILKSEKKANAEVCIISAYWHDVGRLYGTKGHSKTSAKMIKEQMEKFNYDRKIIDDCVKAIENHGWYETPSTLEGEIVRDADKIDFVGISRWKACLDNNCKFEKILELLPILRKEILKLDISKEIYDKEISKLVKYLHNKIFKIEK